jgi:hypothetical protein
MCRSAEQTGGRRRTRPRPGAYLALAAVLCFSVPTAAHAQGGRGKPEASQQVAGEVIDVTGLMERPRGNTRLPWAAPGGFAREPDVDFGRALRDEVLTPVDRNELRRLLELERSLGR